MVRFLAVYDEPDEPEAFDRHYLEVHIPLAKKLPGLRRYTISRNAAATRDREAYYLIAELDWDDMTDLRQAFETPEGRATADDVAKLAPEDKVRTMVYELEGRAPPSTVTITPEPRRKAEAAYLIEQLPHADPRSQRSSFARAQVLRAVAESGGFRRKVAQPSSTVSGPTSEPSGAPQPRSAALRRSPSPAGTWHRHHPPRR